MDDMETRTDGERPGGRLEGIRGAEDVKRLRSRDLPALADEVRAYMLEQVSHTGGHLASSLGAVELCIGLLRVFDPARDRVVWDVGHQTYAWKILTGRRERFGTLRQFGGLTGFQNPKESPCDAFVSGHAGVAFAAAEGFAAGFEAADGAKETRPHVVAVVGDASLGNGGNLEALNNCSQLAEKVILVLNDNEMSISPNVGAFGRMLGKLISGVRYNRVKKAAENAGHRLRLTFLRGIYHRIESRIKSLWLGNAYFERFGLRYIGPVDGNDVQAVEAALQVARDDKRSVVVHLVTVKGKGYVPAELHPTKWHGVGPFPYPAAGAAAGMPRSQADGTAKAKSWSAVFGDALTELARQDERVCVVVAAMKDGTGLADFAAAFPDRFYDVGICEGHAVSFAAGLAASGRRPVVAIYSTFLQRAIDQIQHDVCLQRLNVIFAIDRAGCVGADGATHHGLYDIPLLRCLPGLTFVAPTCAEDLKEALAEALAHGGPWAIRYPRGRAVTRAERAALLPPSGPVAVRLLAVGAQVAKAAAVRDLLAKAGVTAAVEPVLRLKGAGAPARLPPHGRDGTRICTIEDGARTGGWGESVGADLVFGWPDVAIPQGTVSELERAYGFDAESIAAAILRAVRG